MRKQVEAKLEEILELAPDAMVVVDDGGRIVLVNAQTERFFGYTRKELVGRKVEVLIPERYRDAHPELRRGFQAAPRRVRWARADSSTA